MKGLKKVESCLKKEEEVRLWREQTTPEDEYYDGQEMAYQLRLTHDNIERFRSAPESGRRADRRGAHRVPVQIRGSTQSATTKPKS